MLAEVTAAEREFPRRGTSPGKSAPAEAWPKSTAEAATQQGSTESDGTR
jgi:hypothetical protein